MRLLIFFICSRFVELFARPDTELQRNRNVAVVDAMRIARGVTTVQCDRLKLKPRLQASATSSSFQCTTDSYPLRPASPIGRIRLYIHPYKKGRIKMYWLQYTVSANKVIECEGHLFACKQAR